MLQTSNNPAKLFDKKFVALTLRDVRRCEKCKRGYDTKYRLSSDNRPNSSRPVLLNCGHNICENCVYQNRNNFKCAVCHIPIDFEHTRWLKKSYDLNFWLLGQIANSLSFLSSEPAGPPAGAGGMLASELFIQKCSECEQAPAVGICLNCKVDFCKRCFTFVHQNSKVLKKHKLSEFEMQLLQLHMPKEKFCKMHKRICDKFCITCQKVYCNQCIRVGHAAHHVNNLSVENAQHNDKIISFLETMKQTRENIRKAQKEVRACETRLQDYAAAITVEINDYFLEIHNFLQIEERKILEEFKILSRPSQNAIHEACVKLSDSQTTLNNMRSTLEGFLQKPPTNLHVNAIIETATTQLEQMPCQLQISEIKTNPFVFKKVKDVRKELTSSFKVIKNDPKIHIRLSPMYGDEAHSLEISSDTVLSPESNDMDCHEYTVDPPRQATVSSSSTIAIGKSKREGRITSITSPMEFYVQNEETIKDIRRKLAEIDVDSGHVASVEINAMYVVCQSDSKTLHRGIVREEIKPSKNSKDVDTLKFKVFLLDYGVYENIPKQMLRIIPEQLGAIPGAGFPCRLVDVGPAGKEWTKEARQLMEEIIQNKPVQVNIQDTSKTPWSVDIITSNSAGPISLRDALLYTGLGIDTSVSSSQKNQKFCGTKPTQLSKMKQSLQRPMHISGEIFRVNVTHIENPQRFFTIKFSHLEELKMLETEMETEYSSGKKDTQIIYYAQLHMCCALRVDDKWYRGCVEEINSPNDIRVRLVDDGRSVTVNWRQLHVLKERFLASREISIECSLADIQPLQENNYEWTDTAIAEFVRMTSNPTIQMTIASSNQFRYQVILNVVKKHLDINIGAMMVKFKHALSTGEGSAVGENNRVSPVEQILIPDDHLKPIVQAPSNSSIRALKRAPIQVIHINNPGHFYIYLVEHIPGILKFQEQIQIAQENRLAENETMSENSWKENDHCLILTSVNESASEQWHRGIIREIDENEPEAPYTVFLRDQGIVVRDVHSGQLSAIEQNYDRVTDGAILCHLACVHPTGGMKNWSNSAIDEFNHNIGHFESIGATIQGKTKNGSIPVVLWGMLTETNDALGPCTPKYTNINKMLVSAGLAHLVEKIDIARQMDQFVQEEIQQGQQTLQEWYEIFKNTLDNLPTNKDDIDDPQLEKSNISNYEISDLVDNGESGIVTEWLPAELIEKTVFTAYPTYVDYDAIVYMHDADKHHMLNGMRKKINEELNLEPAKTTDENWAPGQPCLARYHLDHCLYRAEIHRNLPNKKFEVRFVDYGNVESCDLADLYRMTAFPNIPIQAIPFSIDGIRPKGGQATFSTTVLDLIHGVIVDKMCAIRVPNGEEKKPIKKCSIRFDRTDLATYLIQNGFASGTGSNPKLGKSIHEWHPVEMPPRHDDSNNSEDELREFMKHQICDPIGNDEADEPSAETEKPKGMFRLDEYDKMFAKMQKDKLYQSIAEDADSEIMDVNCVNDSDEDDVLELEFSFRSNYWHADDNLEGAPPAPRSVAGSNFDEFDPFDTSSLLSNFSGIEAFKVPHLPSSVKSFHCEVAYVRSPTIVHVFPHLSELEFRQMELARRIKSLAHRTPVFDTFEPKTPCLARYTCDKNWYRAIIRSHNTSLRLVKVFYVDFLNSELVKEEYVRRCPIDLLAWPLRTFEMKLYGVKPNPRLREKDVKLAIKKCITGRKLYAKIVMERGRIPEICLYKSRAEKEFPIYDDLIKQKYLCKD